MRGTEGLSGVAKQNRTEDSWLDGWGPDMFRRMRVLSYSWSGHLLGGWQGDERNVGWGQVKEHVGSWENMFSFTLLLLLFAFLLVCVCKLYFVGLVLFLKVYYSNFLFRLY